MRLLTQIIFILLLLISFQSRVYTQNTFAEQNIQESYTQAKAWYNEAQNLVERDPKAGLVLVNKAIHRLDQYSWGGSPDEILRLKIDLYNLGGILHKQLNTHKVAIGYFRKAVNMSALHQYEEGFLISAAHLAQIRDERDKENKKLEGLARWGKNVENSLSELFDQKPFEKSLEELERLVITHMASLEEKQKKYEKALSHQKQLLKMYEADNDSLKVAETRYKIAHILHMKGDYEQGLDFTYAVSEIPDSGMIVVNVDQLNPKAPVVVQTTESSAMIASSETSSSNSKSAKASPTLVPTPPIPQAQNPPVPEVRKRYQKLKNQIKDSGMSRNLDSLDLAYKLNEQKMEVDLLKAESEKQAAEMQKERIRLIAGISLLGLMLLFFIGLLILRSRSHKKLATAYNDLDFAHRKLKTAQTKLVESEKLASLGQLTAGIAHEINNPVNFISGNIGPLQRDLKDIYTLLQAYDQTIHRHKLQDTFKDVNELKEELELNFLTEEINSLIAGINEGATRTSQIVKGLRTFARMDEDVKKTFNIHQGIDSTLTLLNHQCKQIDIKKDYRNLPDIEAFPGKLNQVFMNLLTNAIQAMDGKGEIHITTAFVNNSETLSGGAQTLFSSPNPADQMIRISFKDSGKGIPEKIKQRIFEPFFTTKDVGEGTGLGLPICKGIVEDHKGTIEIFSEEGMGTEVAIILPITHQDTPVTSA